MANCPICSGTKKDEKEKMIKMGKNSSKWYCNGCRTVYTRKDGQWVNV